MKEVWSKNLKKALIWISGYLSFIAFAIVGGYTIVKSDDQDLKKTSKWVFILTLIFTAITAFLFLYHSFGQMTDGYLRSGAYEFYRITTLVVGIVKTILFATFTIIALVQKEK